MELDDHILSMINMTGIETDMVRDVENIRFGVKKMILQVQTERSE